MKQREVTDNNNIRWTCVQAYAGLEGKVDQQTEELSKNSEGKVPVVCTPTGGEQSVRLELNGDWATILTDEELLSQINNHR